MTNTLQSPKSELWSFANGTLSSFGSEPVISYFERNGHSIMKVADIALFRTGTFRDSMGDQRTWEESQMVAFVDNFSRLAETGILPNVPVRRGHPTFGQNPIDTVIGYVTNLKSVTKQANIEKKEYTFLVGDLEIIDKDAQQKIDSKLWRNRSSEIGVYFDNNDNPYEAFMGVAYVDYPAVERLDEYSKTSNHKIITEEEMPETNPAVITPAAPVAPAQFSLGNGIMEANPLVVQNFINSQAAEITGLTAQVAEFGRREGERELAERDAFIDAGVSANLYTAPQAAQHKALVKILNPEQFAAWKATQADLKPQSILQNHGANPGDQNRPDNTVTQPVETQSAEAKLFSDRAAIVRRLGISGVSQDQIMKTAEYKALILADPGYKIPGTVANFK